MASRSRPGFLKDYFQFTAIRVQLQQVILNLILNAAEAMGSVEERAARAIDQHGSNHHTGVSRGSARFPGLASIRYI